MRVFSGSLTFFFFNIPSPPEKKLQAITRKESASHLGVQQIQVCAQVLSASFNSNAEGGNCLSPSSHFVVVLIMILAVQSVA